MTGAFAGGCRSLYEVVRALPAGEVEPLFIAPRGSVHATLRKNSPRGNWWRRFSRRCFCVFGAQSQAARRDGAMVPNKKAA